jgi:hypothetical protein
MSLLRDIQNDVIDTNIDISIILRKCKVLAVRLGNDPFENWVDQELNGYKNKNLLPDYRIIQVYSKGHFSGPFGHSVKNADIPLSCIPGKYRENLSKCYCIESIGYYINLLNNSKGGNLAEQWPPDLVAYTGEDIYQGMNCMSAWKLIPNSSIFSLVEAVRNRILNFVLEIGKEAPDAGEDSPKTQKISPEKVSQVFNTTIYGNVGNISEASQNVNQTVTINVLQNDLNSLKAYLSSVGIPKREIQKLEEAIQEDSAEEVNKNEKLGKKVFAWIKSVSSKIKNEAFPVLQSVSANLITQAILKYYGVN